MTASVRELGALLRARRISPVELAESCLKRLESVGPKLNAVVTITRERALEQARRAEREIAAGKYRGPLHGIPYGAKDLLATRGIRTSWGARPYAEQVFDYDAAVIRRLERAGAVLAAKLAMVELAGGMGYRTPAASFTGPGRNPWNPERWAGGSSSGSGAAVAAALVPLAIGTETWGSILTPGAFCGVTGLRPTYDRVSRQGAMALSWSMDKIGPMARSAADCRLALGVMAESFRAAAAPTKAPLRLGRVANWKTVSPGIERAFDDAVKVLSDAGARIEDVKLPDYPYDAVAGAIISAEAAGAFEELVASGRVAELADEGSRIGGYVNTSVPGTDYVKCLRIRCRMQRDWDRLLSRYDALIAPTLPVVAPPVSADLREIFSMPDPLGAAGNLCGLPAITVPCGPAEDGLPAGIQFAGRAYEEARILRAAELFQSRTDWHRREPAGPA